MEIDKTLCFQMHPLLSKILQIHPLLSKIWCIGGSEWLSFFSTVSYGIFHEDFKTVFKKGALTRPPA